METMNVTQVQENVEYDETTLLQTVLVTMKSLQEAEKATYPASGELANSRTIWC